MDIAKIEDKLDKAAIAGTEVAVSFGGIKFQTMVEVFEAAKLLAMAGPAIPKWLQGNPGGCWAVIIQAIEWGFSPIQVARMSFEVSGVVGYMSQLIHAVVEARAPLKERLRCAFDGDGETRVCIVTGHIKGEATSLEYRSPPVGKIKVKNSPLWTSDTDQQLWFYSSRAWCRRYAPDVLLGVYSREELAEGVGPENAKDITPGIAARLKGADGKRGFNRDHVEKETGGKTIEQEPDRDPRAIAYDEGTVAHDNGLPITAYGGADAVLKEAFADGWRSKGLQPSLELIGSDVTASQAAAA